jgi:hypothetical protein
MKMMKKKNFLNIVASALTSIKDFEVLNSKEIELFEEMLTFGGRAKLRTLLKK